MPWASAESRRPPICAAWADRARAPAKKAAPPKGAPHERPARKRRALGQVGGSVELFSGDAAERRALCSALGVRADESLTRAHVHGFFGYAARLHPGTAAGLIRAFSAPGQRVLDPFCGSGTVVVEAQLAGRDALGADASPLAVALASFKLAGARPQQLDALVEGAEQVLAHARERRRARAGPTRRYDSADRHAFEIHVLLELDGLRDGISHISDPWVRGALSMVLTSMLNKLSQRPDDEGHRSRHAGGFALRFFLDKTRELSARFSEFARLLPKRRPPYAITLSDARRLFHVPSASVDLVVSSPPYAGVYDYHDQHQTALRWLELDGRRFRQTEIGARRKLSKLPYRTALAAWEREFGQCLLELSRVLTERGVVCLVTADSALGRQAVRSDEVIARLAGRAGLAVSAHAAQLRPAYGRPSQQAFDREPRREHALVLRKNAPAAVRGAR